MVKLKKIKHKEELREKFENVCFTIFSEAKNLELYLELIEEFRIKGNSDLDLVNIITNCFGLQVASIFSRIIEKSSRDSANIFYIKNTINSNINVLSKSKKESVKLLKLSSDINDFANMYKVDIEVFEDIKDVKISHNDLRLAKLKQEKSIRFSLVRMNEIKNCLIKIFYKIEYKDKFKKEKLDKIKEEANLFY